MAAEVQGQMLPPGASTAVGGNQYGVDTQNLFTRGAAVPENRGETMVQRHDRMMQEASQARAMEKLRALLPTFSAATCRLALKEANWDVEEAVAMIRTFQAERDAEVTSLQKRRTKALLSGGTKNDGAGSSSDSESGGESSSSGSEDASAESDDSRDSRKRKRSSGKDKDRKSSKRSKSSKHSSKKKHDKDKRKRRKEKEKTRSKDKDKEKSKDKAKEKGSGLAGASDFGKYGILREVDMSTKRDEFLMWAAEVKKMDVEVLDRYEEKDLFKDFMEDYNTATLPHRKYYNLEAYDREKALKAAKQGKAVQKKPVSLRDDEEALRRAKEEERARLARERFDEAYKAMKYSDKAKDMKEQEMLRREMELAYKTGDFAKAQRLLTRLNPEEKK